MFTTGVVANEYFALTSTALAITAGVEYFDLIATMWQGVVRFATPMLFALGFLLQFLIGGLTGIIVASPPLNYDLNDSYFVVGHFHYTLFAGSMFGLLAGIYYWFPKFTGTLLSERLGRIQFVLTVVGTNLAFFPMLVLGYDGMARRVADYPASSGFETWNAISTAGAWVIALSFAVFLLNIVLSLARGVPAGDDPWQAQTLEWATSSPPPPENFRQPARDPLLCAAARSAPGGAAMTARWHAPALWGAMLLFWGVVLAVWSASALQAAPLLLAGAGGLVIAGLAARGRWMAVRRPAAAAMAAVGLTLALLGIVAGLWLTLIGAAVVLAAIGLGLRP